MYLRIWLNLRLYILTTFECITDFMYYLKSLSIAATSRNALISSWNIPICDRRWVKCLLSANKLSLVEITASVKTSLSKVEKPLLIAHRR